MHETTSERDIQMKPEWATFNQKVETRVSTTLPLSHDQHDGHVACLRETMRLAQLSSGGADSSNRQLDMVVLKSKY